MWINLKSYGEGDSLVASTVSRLFGVKGSVPRQIYILFLKQPSSTLFELGKRIWQWEN